MAVVKGENPAFSRALQLTVRDDASCKTRIQVLNENIFIFFYQNNIWLLDREERPYCATSSIRSFEATIRVINPHAPTSCGTPLHSPMQSDLLDPFNHYATTALTCVHQKKGLRSIQLEPVPRSKTCFYVVLLEKKTVAEYFPYSTLVALGIKYLKTLISLIPDVPEGVVAIFEPPAVLEDGLPRVFTTLLEVFVSVIL